MSETSPGTELQGFLKSAALAAAGAREILLKHYGNLHKVSEKFQAGLVSEADQESEDFIKKLLTEKYPEHRFLGEETGLTTGSSSASSFSTKIEDKSGYLWMIDPLDGTTNYVHGFPAFCISIGLEIRGTLSVAVVDAPKMGLHFHAIKGGGAFLNGKRIHVSNRVEFKDGLFATGFSSQDETLEDTFDLLSLIIRGARGVRRAGSAALDLCWVAQGVFDCFWEKNLSPWDTAAGALIAGEAGARVTDLRGAPYDPRTPSILVGTPVIHQQVLQMYQQIRRA